MIWIKSLRPRTVLMAGLLCIVGFKVGDVPIETAEVLAVVFILIVGGFTMAINDWQDRFADFNGGRRFVVQNSRAYYRFMIILGILTCTTSVILLMANFKYGILSFVLIFLGTMYGKIRKIPFTPGIYMAVCSVGPLLFSYLNSPTATSLNCILSGVLLYIYGRETLKDLEDRTQDKGTKWTIPNAFGEKNAIYIIFASYIFATIAFTFVTLVALMAYPFIVLAYFVLQTKGNKRLVKSLTDLPFISLMIYVVL